MKEGELALVPKGLNLPKTDAYVVEYDSNEFLCEYFKLDASKLHYKGAFLEDALLALAISKVLFDETDIDTQFSLSAASQISKRDIAQILRGLRKTRKDKSGNVVITTGELLQDDAIETSFEADEYNSWLYEGGGIALQNDKLAAEGLVAFPAFSLPFDASGWFKEPLPQTTMAFIGMYQNNPLKYRLFGLGGEVFELVMGGAVARVPGEPGVSVLDNLINGDLDAAEFLGPAADEQAFFSEPGMPALYYYITAWHSPTTVIQLYLNKDVYYSLTSNRGKNDACSDCG